MLRRALLVVLLLGLAACGGDEREAALCRDIVPALVEGATNVIASDSDRIPAPQVRVRFADAGGGLRTLACRFGDRQPEDDRPMLLGVALDGTPLSGIQVAMLRIAFGLPTPPALFAEPPPPAPLARAIAYLLQQLINGLSLGAILALVAVGYSLVYGITGTIQFAYGEIFMIGAVLVATVYAGAAAAGYGGLGVIAIAVPVVGCVTAAYGWVVDRIVYRPLRGRSGFAALIAAVGLSIALREYVRLAQGTGNKWLPALLPQHLAVFRGAGFDVLIGEVQVFVLALALVLGLGLVWLMGRTSFGRAHRACADDFGMAALLGVDVGRTVAVTFILGAALAAVAGIAVAVYYGEADFMMGYLFGFKALTAALLGGFGSLGGALLGGLLLGVFEALWSAYLGLAYKDAAIFALLILVLVFRPQGLLGKSEAG